MTTSDSLTLAGVIGTWVGASVGIVALVGIVAPLLVWRATRTERFQAIAAVAQDSNGFVSSGISIWPSLRVFRRVRVPVLRRVPSLTIQQFVWDVQNLPEQKLSSSWVQLGTLLRAYGVAFPVGNELEIHDATAYLRVHRAWILVVGLLGRFSLRHDKGQIKRQKTAVLRVPSPKEVPSAQLNDARFQPAYSIGEGLQTINAPEGDVLYGITGTLRFSKEEINRGPGPTTVRFDLDSKSSLTFEPEILSLAQIFMLSLGCIPMADKKFFSLRDLSTFEDDLFVDDPMELDLTNTRRDPNTFNFNQRYASAAPDPFGAQDIRFGTLKRHSRIGIQAFKLEAVVEHADNLTQLGKPFAAEETTILSLETFHPSQDEVSTLQSFKDRTYLPASCDWVRLGKPQDLYATSEAERPEESYIVRADAQLMALALLQLPWHPESYLLGADKSDQCLHLLLGCSSQLQALMSYTQKGIEYLGLAVPDRRKLSSAIESLFRQFNKSTKPLRATYYEMFKLENILKTISHTNQQVNEMIGITTMTNPEFLDLMRQSARRFREAVDAAIKIDMRSGIIQVPVAFGIIQEFPLNVTELYPTRAASDEVVSVKYSLVLIVTLRACLRSAMLGDCFSSIPLIHEVLGLEDVIWIS